MIDPMKVVTRVVVFIGLLLAGCSSTQVDDTANMPYFAPGQLLELPLPGDLGRTVEMSQMITVRHDGEMFAFEGHISISPDRFLLVGIDGIGRRAMSVTWEKSGRITAERADWLPPAVRPGPMLADIVLLYWPAGILRQALMPAGAVVMDMPGSRRIAIDGVDILTVDYIAGGDQATDGRLHYRNTAWGYEIDVQSVEVAP